MAELHIEKKNIQKIFSERKECKKFVIPEYQRPYAWEIEECDTLWSDIIDFYTEHQNDNEAYFLGTIVTCIQEDGIDIIDGQQRVPSFSLILRAIYRMLEDEITETDPVINLKQKIAPCLWIQEDELSNHFDHTKIIMESKIITDEESKELHEILKNGHAYDATKSFYGKNYNFFYSKCKDFAATSPTQWYRLCLTILTRCILLPIECNNPETAWTIFATLNDRGMPLSDSDIFKAQIYKSCRTDDEKTAFSEKWKELAESVKKANMTIDDLFRHYTHVIRAERNDISKEIGLRKFYQGGNNYAIFKEIDIISELQLLADFWMKVQETSTEEINEKKKKYYSNDQYFTTNSKKYFHCMTHYPNEYWKYLISVFYLKNKNLSPAEFKNIFESFMENTTAFMLCRFITNPTVNSIKDAMFKHAISLVSDPSSKFAMPIEESLLKESMSAIGNSKIIRSLLLLYAYTCWCGQSMISIDAHIEHILPQKWIAENYDGWNKKDAQEYLECIGNKVMLEWKENISAGNGYFGKKKEKYKNSDIIEVKISLANFHSDNWGKEALLTRDNTVKSQLVSFFKSKLQ